jgi:hypothetical protein
MTEKPEHGTPEHGDKQETPPISDILSAGGFDTKAVLGDVAPIHDSDLAESSEADNRSGGN